MPQIRDSTLRRKQIINGLKIKTAKAGGVLLLATALGSGALMHSSRQNARLDAQIRQSQITARQEQVKYDRLRAELNAKYKAEIFQYQLLQKMRERSEELNQKAIREQNSRLQRKGAGGKGALPVRKYEDPVGQESMYARVRFPLKHISAQYIDAELSEVRSPFAGRGAKIIELAQKYDVDPGFFLSVSIEESRAGTKGLGAKNRNPTNIRWTSRSRFPKGAGGFIKYPSWEAGISGFFADIAKGSYYYRAGRESVDSIIATRSPRNENSTDRMIAQITKRMDGYRREGID